MSKKEINVVVIGHANSGKSTITGCLICKCGGIDMETLEAFEKDAKDISKALNSDANAVFNKLKDTWILDRLKVEKITVWKLTTSNFHVTLTDAPVLRKEDTQISKADCAVLVIAAGINTYIKQTKKYILCSYALGIKQMIVCVNMMDITKPPFCESLFENIKKDLSAYIKDIGYDPATVAFVPIAGWTGDNISEPSSKMPWYKGWTIERKERKFVGHTLLQVLNAIEPYSRLINQKESREPNQSVEEKDSKMQIG